MNSKKLVILLATVGIVAVIIYYFATHDSNLWMNIVASASVFLVGLALIYLIVERRINEEKRARKRPVEHLVLEGVLAHAIAIVRMIGIYATQDDLEVKPLENNKEMTEKTESFAKKVIREGLQLPQSSFQKEAAIKFNRLLDDVLENLFSLQGRYPFVIEEYPDVATILSSLEAKQSSIKSAFYWAFLDTRTNASECKQQVEKTLVDVIKICNELAEMTSRCMEQIADSRNPMKQEIQKGNRNGGNTSKADKTLNQELTLRDIEEHLKRQDRQAAKSVYVTSAALGGSIVLVGISLWLGSRILSASALFWDYVFIVTVGFIFMFGCWYKQRKIKD